MSGLFSIVAALALSGAGMACLCLAMDRHYEQVRGTRKVPPRWRRVARGGGWLLLALAFVFCAKVWGVGIGAVTWCAALTAGAMAVIWVLPYAPRAVIRSAAIAATLGLAIAAWQLVVPGAPGGLSNRVVEVEK